MDWCYYILKLNKGQLTKMKKLKANNKGRFTLVTYESKNKHYIMALLIILFGIIDCANTVFLHEIAKANPALTIIQNFQIIFTIIFAHYFLHIKWYKHQWLSASFIVIGSLLSFFFFNKLFYEKNYLYLIIMFGILVFLALQEVLEKAVLLLGMSPSELILYEGICGIIFCLLTITVSTIIHYYNSSLLKFFERNSFKYFGRINKLIFDNPLNILFLFIYIFLNMFYSLFIKSSNYYFTPMSRAISDTISIFMTNFFYQMYLGTMNEKYIICVIIGFVFILSGCLLYNEIIIIRGSGFATNTKDEIDKRGSKENEALIKEREDLEISFDSFNYSENKEGFSRNDTITIE